MSYKERNIDVGQAVTDLTNRTLARLPSDFSRLVYLASSRDYNNGQIPRWPRISFQRKRGLESSCRVPPREFSPGLCTPLLEELIAELRNYISATEERPKTF